MTTADMVSDRRFIERKSDITCEWLEAVLSPMVPGVRITEFERLDHITGAQCKVRVRISTNAAGKAVGLPGRLMIKSDIDEFGRGPVAYVRFNEPLIYRDVVPSLGVEVPRVWAAESGEAGLSFLVMEDLTERHVQFCFLGEPITPTLAARFLESLARIHARWWNSPELRDDGRFGGLRKPMVGMFETYVQKHLSPEVFTYFASLPRAAATPVELRDPDRLREGLFQLAEFHRGMPLSLLHGDAHLNNLYVTSDGKPGFLDWASRRAPWSNDVAYFLPCALDVTDRRRHERRLLRHYLRALAREGVEAPSFEEAWLAYRRELIWGMFVFLINGPTQTEFSNTAATARFGAAMLDHKTFDLLGV